MDIKIEADVKDELFENLEDDETSSHHLKQVPALEETLKRNSFGSIEVKNEIEVKEEELDSKDDDVEVKEEPFDGEVEKIEVKEEAFDGMKEEFEVEEDPLSFDDEDTANKLFDKISHLNENQSHMSNAAEGGETGSKVKNVLKRGPRRAVTAQQNIKNNPLQNFGSGYELKSKKLGIRKFKCDYCSYECNFKSVFKNHLQTHSSSGGGGGGGVELYKCSDCSYECKRKKYLKAHMLSHTNVKLFKCSSCSYECNSKGNFKTHMLTHSGSEKEHSNIEIGPRRWLKSERGK
ncbi:UNVERIFIED_CONTAM: hypothetical protein RMT77_017081 [Armadillidium vulgare]